MNTIRKAVAIGSLLAGGILPLAASAAPAAAVAPCYTPDGVGRFNGGASVTGTLYWTSSRSGSYSVRVSNTRDGKEAYLYVQFLKHMNYGLSYWTGAYRLRVADGYAQTFTYGFNQPFQVDAVSFGLLNQDQYKFETVWDTNRVCGG